MNGHINIQPRVLDMPTEELGASAYRKYDMEAWMPGRNDWGEVSSASNCTDYQARRLDIRWRPDPRQKAVFAHTLNGTACAVPRIILSILETHQTADKRVRIPKALRPWMNGAEYIEPPTL
jgi:seryl-tRNA synthetase